MEQQPIVEMKSISKSFPGVKALQNVDFTLMPGSVHALVGENGAGKSTLMKILSGTYATYEGQVFYQGQLVHFRNEHDALAAGISIVPQELNYVDKLTVEDNIYLGREFMRGKHSPFRDKKRQSEEAAKLIQSLNLNFDGKTYMSDLSVAQCQMVEIIKAISRDARVIIMDEPTSALTDVETQQLYGHVRRLSQEGIAIVYISHKLEEVFALCDHITVMRDSKLIGSLPAKDADQASLIKMMINRDVGSMYPPIGEPGTEEVLRVEGYSQPGVFSDVSFTLHRGEILGFAGMMGAGRSEIARAIFGLDPHTSGRLVFEGKEVSIHTPSDAIKLGIGMVTEDRANYGFVGGLSVKDNVALPNGDLFAPKGWLQKKKMQRETERMRASLSIKVPNIESKVMNLSGGNQQKVVLAKWLVRQMKVLIIDEPTRGIDIGAKEEIYKLIKQLAEEGMAVLMISSEMNEVIGVAQRILVIDGGRVLGQFTKDHVSQFDIMKMIVEGDRKL